jgi:hypothetical protein
MANVQHFYLSGKCKSKLYWDNFILPKSERLFTKEWTNAWEDTGGKEGLYTVVDGNQPRHYGNQYGGASRN